MSLFSFRSRMAAKESILVGQLSLSNALLILFIICIDGSVRGRGKIMSKFMHDFCVCRYGDHSLL